MKTPRYIVAAVAAALLSTVAAWAGDPTGTWKWTEAGRQGQTREITAKLELKDGKLTGTVTAPGRGGGAPQEIAISKATFANDEIAFSVERTFNDMTRETKYAGKLEGDSITGKVQAPAGRGGEAPPAADWKATRSK